MRWGLIGCGDVVRKRVAQAIIDHPGSQLIAACRRDGKRLHQFCNDFRLPKAYSDALELFGDSEIDAVYIATPVSEHLSQTVVAAQAGKHVLVEKPMAMSVAECNQMIVACDRSGVKLGVAYYRRFYSMVDRIRDLLSKSAIGIPLAVSAITATPMSMSSQEDGYWRALPNASGGGALMDVGSHRVDLFRYLFGEITSVKSVCRTVAADYPVEDTALLLLQFRSGMTGTLQCHFGCDDPDEFVITGTKGRLIARPLNGDTLIIESGSRQKLETHPPPKNFCGPLVADFVDAIQTGRDPEVPGSDGLLTNRVMEWAYDDAMRKA
ncbi:MAG: Gfo/Idh/MocA family oxidoreductase [Planctomycetota bacterium]